MEGALRPDLAAVARDRADDRTREAERIARVAPQGGLALAVEALDAYAAHFARRANAAGIAGMRDDEARERRFAAGVRRISAVVESIADDPRLALSEDACAAVRGALSGEPWAVGGHLEDGPKRDRVLAELRAAFGAPGRGA